jgi:hypothetical protein
MKYKIFEMVEPEVLQKIDRDGWCNSVISLTVLKDMESGSVLDNRYNSFDEAMADIRNNSNKNKFKKFTIMPVIEIDWDGTIRGEEKEDE